LCGLNLAISDPVTFYLTVVCTDVFTMDSKYSVAAAFELAASRNTRYVYDRLHPGFGFY
jgi:hypothetical protein